MNQQLNEIKAALSKATPGPWEYSYEFDEIGPRNDDHGDFAICKKIQWYDNGILISRAPEWLESLVSQVEEMQKTIEWLGNITNDGLVKTEVKKILQALIGGEQE